MKKRITKEGVKVNMSEGKEITLQEWIMGGLVEWFREVVKDVLEIAMKEELTEFLGYSPYSREEEKDNYRNGYRVRDFHTRFGEIKDLMVPRDRMGEFETELVGKYKRREQRIDEQIWELFIGGISTGKMKKITKGLFGKGYSPSTISRVNKELTKEMREWVEGEIREEIKYLFIDGINLPVRRFHVSKESLLVVIGITNTGHRKVLGVSLGNRESAKNWETFLKDLIRRGLKGVKLGIMDGLPGLERAFSECFPKAKVQRCMVHKLWNVAANLPPCIQKECLDQLKRVFYAKDEEEARERANIWKEHWENVAQSAVRCFFKDIESVLTFYAFPSNHWRYIRTTNIIERAFKEFRRRTRAMDSFPNEDCCLRCIFAISKNLNEKWSQRRLANFDIFKETA